MRADSDGKYSELPASVAARSARLRSTKARRSSRVTPWQVTLPPDPAAGVLDVYHASEHLHAAASVTPEDARIHFALARLYRRTGDTEAAAREMKAFEEAGVTRMVIPYVPVTEPVVEDARRFLEAWGRG